MTTSDTPTTNHAPRSHRVRRLSRSAAPIADYQHTKELITGLTAALKAKDEYTFHHSRRVANVAALIGKSLDLPPESIGRLHLGGLLHDIGKLGIHDSILKKCDQLTHEEFEEIKRHPEIGCDILRGIESLRSVLPIIRHHHERVDGAGYPDQLSGNDIPLEAKILAVADSFDAMTSDRAYRDGKSLERAIEILESGCGTQWDTRIVNVLVSLKSEVAAACGLATHKPVPHFKSHLQSHTLANTQSLANTRSPSNTHTPSITVDRSNIRASEQSHVLNVVKMPESPIPSSNK